MDYLEPDSISLTYKTSSGEFSSYTAGAPGTSHRVSVVKQLQTKNGFKLACSNFFPTRDEGDKHSLSLKNTGFKSQGGWNYTDIVGAGLGTLLTD